MTERKALSMRRRCETFEIDFGGLSKSHVITVGYYPDDTPGEVFISGGKSGEQVEAIARDGAVLVSMCLQHGVSLDTIRHALTRDSQDQPSSIIGVVVDRLAEPDRPI
ncbi:hypothetical protein KIP88_03060 [Bradyrhizobium sp. SRL28]|uniref:TSCPD domain-containing protein n=1 Tax=Bradyrhizobium sp. SRL28 TaxID=2836178 RepID=UPI001BDF3D80|nr:hypothetical protein [Bradyrhizobium sp. SRL28]MBT1509472.1 hypothetical protein [Bradyrhizobium sp. SRL28]